VRGYAARGAWEPASGNLDADPQALQGEIRALSDEVAALRAELAAAKGQQPELDNTDPADQD
jgi:hypothetical protein